MALLNLRSFLTWTVCVVRSMLFFDDIYILPTLFGNWGRLFNPVEEKYRWISNKNMKYHPISWGVVYFFNRYYQMQYIIREHESLDPFPLTLHSTLRCLLFPTISGATLCRIRVGIRRSLALSLSILSILCPGGTPSWGLNGDVRPARVCFSGFLS